MFDLSKLQPVLQSLALAISLMTALGGALLLATWFSLIIWAFHDIRTRTTDTFTQLMAALMVAVLFIPGAILYYMLRPAETLGAVHERKLLEQALTPEPEEPEYICPGCEREVDRRWMVCPYCLYQLREPCPQCGELMELDWRSCAFCGQLAGEQRQPARAILPAVPVPAVGLNLPGDHRDGHADRSTPPKDSSSMTQAPI